MATYRLTGPDGSTYNVTAPDEVSQDDVLKTFHANLPAAAPAASPSYLDKVKANISSSADAAKDMALGAVRGAGSIGATLLAPIDAGARALGVQNDYIGRDDRRQAMTDATQTLGADPNSFAYKTGKLGSEVAGTAGAGGVLAKGAQGLGAAPEIVNALRTSGFSTGAPVASGAKALAGDLATRTLAGGAAAGAQVGLASPGDAGTGALIGAALPGALKVAGAAGNAFLGGALSPERAALARRAADLGIDVPVDRVADSKPLNALASSLNYVPFSGRTATEGKMIDQVKTALTNTFGESSPNVGQALRKASDRLGGQFETTLKSTPVKVDESLLNGLGDVEKTAQGELGKEQFAPIKNQIDAILAKGSSGEIDGQAAYNIKRALDRISDRNSPEAWHAIQLKKQLMGALDRSLGPEEAAAFKTTREQYGNMLDVQGLARNGADGDISVASLANMRNVQNPKLKELADIATDFIKTRESNHGAAQRVGIGAVAAGAGHFVPGAAVPIAAGIAAGRGTNMLLNSSTLRNALINGSSPLPEQVNALAGPAVYRSLPRNASQNP